VRTNPTMSQQQGGEGEGEQGLPLEQDMFNLRFRNDQLPSGKCVYIQSGDPGDFDGYMIGVAGAELEKRTEDLQFVIVMPERRACADREEPNVNKHDEGFSEEVMHVAGRLIRYLCPHSFIVRGPVNTRNVIPLKFIFSEPEHYGPIVSNLPPGAVYWRSVEDLASLVADEQVSSVVLDMNGSVGYLKQLLQLYPKLGAKVHASGMPVTVMAGILAEAETATMRVPGRDPRSTMNALYHAESSKMLLQMAKENEVPLLFITNNVCNKLLRFENATEIARVMGLQGLMSELARSWYGPHLTGRCVPFDWVSFCSLLLHKRFEGLIRCEPRQLYVGADDPSVMVLLEPGLPITPTVEQNLEGAKFWGEVMSVVDIDRDIMLKLVHFTMDSSDQCKQPVS